MMEDHDTLRLIEAAGNSAPEDTEAHQNVIDNVGVKDALVKNRHHPADRRPIALLVTPTGGIEETEIALVDSVASTDTAAPPLAEVVARAELQQLFLVVVSPSSEALVVGLPAWSDPSATAADKEPVLNVDKVTALSIKFHVRSDQDAGVDAIDLFRNGAVT